MDFDGMLGWASLGALIISVAGLIGYAVWDDAHAVKFSLRRDEWRCAASHRETSTDIVTTGKVVIPVISTRTVCDRYDRRYPQSTGAKILPRTD